MLNINYEQLIKDSNGRIAVEDLQLLERACDFCQAKNILEIGSADGGSSVILGLKAKERGGHLCCIEPQPRGRMKANMAHYELAGHYTLFAMASPWVPLERIPELDLLFIDGRHETRWALVDYHYFEPHVRPKGIIIFHDTSGHCQEDRKQPDYGKAGYVPLVQRAINLILTTDELLEIGRSDARNGGAIAFQKP